MAGSTSLTPEQLSTRGSIAVNERWAKATAKDREDNGRRGQQGLRDKFEAEIRGEFPGLTDDEYARMAENKYRAHFQRLAFNSSKARKARASGAA
jgi:hypothetical protein